MSQLELLNGQTLFAVSEAQGTQSFKFSACMLAAYTPVTSSASLASFVGLKVIAVSHAKSKAITVAFERGAQFSISLRPEHYAGPEAFSAQFNGVTVVE